MTEKAILTAGAVYDNIVATTEGEPYRPWSQVRDTMAADPKTRHLVAYLPQRLGRAVTRSRMPRLIHGRHPDAIRPEKTAYSQNGAR